jgi:transposase
MMGRLNHEQEQLFYEFQLDEVVPDDHLVRAIAAVLDLSWVRGDLAPYYSPLGRPSIDPVLMIRMLIVGYAFAIRSERLLCREVRVNLAYRWFAASASRTRFRIIRRSRVRGTSGSVTVTFSAGCSSVLLRPVLRPGWSVVKGLRSMRA